MIPSRTFVHLLIAVRKSRPEVAHSRQLFWRSGTTLKPLPQRISGTFPQKRLCLVETQHVQPAGGVISCRAASLLDTERSRILSAAVRCLQISRVSPRVSPDSRRLWQRTTIRHEVCDGQCGRSDSQCRTPLHERDSDVDVLTNHGGGTAGQGGPELLHVSCSDRMQLMSVCRHCRPFPRSGRSFGRHAIAQICSNK